MKIARMDTSASIDRRVARTRAMLQDALIAMIPEGGYAPITVEDICRKANVGRSTFYAHYTGKDELRSATIDAHLQSLTKEHDLAASQMGGRVFHFSRPMFQHAYAFRSLHHALHASGEDAIHDEFRERIRRTVRQELAGKSPVEAGIRPSSLSSSSPARSYPCWPGGLRRTQTFHLCGLMRCFSG